VDLQLTEEQRWLAESVDELLARADGDGTFGSLAQFGAFDVGEDGLGAVELALIARGVGTRLAAVPFVESAAVHYAVDLGGASVSPCLAEPGATYADGRVTGEATGVGYASSVELLAVPATGDGGVVLAVVPSSAAEIEAEPTLDPTVAPAHVRLAGADVERLAGDSATVATIASAGAVLAAAEAVGAAAAALELAREYAGQRRQFGRTIGSFQAVRHILADMYVRMESSWSSVLYAAASLDEHEADSARTAAIAKAYASRATQEVAHGALQVFGGIAFTAEHPAHRFLRRIVVRGESFGSARDHERAVARSLTAS
jgi:alkylation response protein AidB-like acyl-CoA dehydrogenase